MTGTSIFLLPNGTFFVEWLVVAIILFLMTKYILPPLNKALEARQEKNSWMPSSRGILPSVASEPHGKPENIAWRSRQIIQDFPRRSFLDRRQADDDVGHAESEIPDLSFERKQEVHVGVCGIVELDGLGR